MNVTAFSLKFCQHDIVPWCNLSKHLDLIWALLHNSLQEGLGSNSANSSANEKSYPLLLTDLDIQQRSLSTEQRLHPGKITWKWWPFPNFTWPQRQCLISLCYSESRWTTRKESRDLLKTQLLLLSLDFPGQYISIFSTEREKRKPHSSTLSLKSNSCKIILKEISCLLKEETHSQPTFLHCLWFNKLSICTVSVCVHPCMTKRSNQTTLALFSFLWSNRNSCSMEELLNMKDGKCQIDHQK